MLYGRLKVVAGIAQLVEHDLAKGQGREFDLVSRSKSLQMIFRCGNSSVGRARPCQGRGREFSLVSRSNHQHSLKTHVAGIAQLVEHDLAKVGVASSVSFPAPIRISKLLQMIIPMRE